MGRRGKGKNHERLVLTTKKKGVTTHFKYEKHNKSDF